MIKKKELAIFLSKLETHLEPKLLLEQYATPSTLAANLLYMAAFVFNDIIEKKVCDLGCGSGILALGATYLGSRMTAGIDIDKTAIQTSKKNCEKTGLHVDLVMGDINILKDRFDTVIENPPFGVRKEGADIKFLTKALSIANIVYSIHKGGGKNRAFINTTIINKLNGEVTNIVEAELVIHHTFSFHKKPKHNVKVDIYRIARKRV